jgi:hypothetical protein
MAISYGTTFVWNGPLRRFPARAVPETGESQITAIYDDCGSASTALQLLMDTSGVMEQYDEAQEQVRAGRVVAAATAAGRARAQISG